MKYELLGLEKIICIDLAPTNFNKERNKAAFIKKCRSSILEEVDRIQNGWVYEILNCENEKRITYYIHQHQQGLIKLLDTFQAYLMKENRGHIYNYPALKSFIDSYKGLLTALDQMLVFLLNHSYQYINQAYKIADYNRLVLIPGIKQILKQCSNELENRKIDNILAEIIVIPFRYFITIENLINQRDLNYLMVYRKEVDGLLTKKEMSPFSIYEFLIQLNFNDPTFTFYYIEKLKESDINYTITGRTEFYYLQLKIINQITKKPGLAYDCSLPSVHDQLATWLSEEIFFLEKKQQLENSFPTSTNDQNAKSEKVQTVLSVPQLSLAVKLLLDSGIIKTKHTRDVMRMVAQNFRTGNIEQISEDSLRNKIYNIEPAAVEGMKKVIMGLWDKVREY